jgi:outer membrane protein TolC
MKFHICFILKTFQFRKFLRQIYFIKCVFLSFSFLIFLSTKNVFSQNIQNNSSLEIDWKNLSKIFKDRYMTYSNNRLDKFIAEQEQKAGDPWRIDPKLTVSYQEIKSLQPQTALQATLVQKFPTGTNITLASGQTIYSGNVTPQTMLNPNQLPDNGQPVTTNSVTLLQNLLKDSFLYGIPQSSINEATYQLSKVTADMTFAKSLREIYRDYVSVINDRELLNQAKDALLRSEASLLQAQDAINRGFKAKSEVYTFESTVNLNQISLNNAQTQFDTAIKKLNFNLWYSNEDSSVSLAMNADLDSFIAFLKNKLKNNKSFDQTTAEKQYDLDKAKTDDEKNKALPQLDFSVTWSKIQNNSAVGTLVQTPQQSTEAPTLIYEPTTGYQQMYLLTFSMPLFSTFTRNRVSVANAQAMQSKSSLEHASQNAEMLWEVNQKNIKINEMKLKLRREIKLLNMKNMEAIEQKYRDGTATNMDVQAAQVNLDQSESNTITAKTDLIYSLLQTQFDSGNILEVFYE